MLVVYPLLPRGERPACVYGLIDPRYGVVRYVGYTINPKDRYKSHYSAQELADDTNKNRWLKGLLRRGLKARMVLLEECPESAVCALERAYIAAYKARGYKLTNTTDGGGGWLGAKHSAATRAKMRELATGRPSTTKGIPRSPDDRAAISRGRAKAWEKQKDAGYAPLPPQLTETSLAKMAASLRGRKLSPEQRAAIAAGGRGKKHSAETKAKISAAVHCYWQKRKEE